MTVEQIGSYLQGDARQLRLELREEVSSTNTVLKEEALAGEPEGKVLLAKRQTAGKGRMGRGFYSPEETGIYMSLLLRPRLGTQESLLITTAAAVAVAIAIEKAAGQEAHIKWVNDVYCHGKKVVGILTEGGMGPGGHQLSYAVLGIGINVWDPKGGFPAELASVAGSVMAEEEQNRDLRNRLAAAVLNEFMKLYPHLADRGFMTEYRKRSFIIGKTVRLLSSDHLELPDLSEAKVLDIGGDAQLILLLPDGTIREVSSGQVSVRAARA